MENYSSFNFIVGCFALLLFCLYKLYNEIRPRYHYHEYGIHSSVINEELLYANASCWCGKLIPVYRAVAKGIPIKCWNKNRVLVFSPELVKLAKELHES